MIMYPGDEFPQQETFAMTKFMHHRAAPVHTFSLWMTTLLSLLFLCPLAGAQQTISLIEPTKAWTFSNGAEFPGATGGLTLDPQTTRAGQASLKLLGDFTKGGNYVQAGRKIDSVDIRELSLWVKSPDAERFTLRLNDASGQTHQIVVKMEAQPDWQHIMLPLERFFARRGQAD